MLEAVDLHCVRGERTLFRALGFRLGSGELLRVAGANGSGKTSLLRILCGLAAPERGAVRWRGQNIRTLREEYWKELVYVGHANALKDDLSAAENLAVSCALAGRAADGRQIEAALAAFGLAASARLPARVLSQGQRRRVALARLALRAEAPLWVLDEPFAALDAEAIERVQALVAGHLARGAAVIYTSHQEAHIPAPLAHCIELGTARGA